MKSKYFIILFLMVCSTITRPQSNKPLLMAHFMPWNSAPPVESTWGWHWTMNFFDPEKIDETGKREIASHFYPLTGPYDSMDPDIMEYQVLLMKLSGIDGIMVDWYGIGELWDYPAINTRTLAIFQVIEQAGLLFSIVYEDQTITHMISQNVLNGEESLDHAKQVMAYLESTWFNKDAYLKINNRPVLLSFGPQYFKLATQWQKIFSDLSVEPLFFTLDNILTHAAVGAFSWPPMWKSNADGVLTQADLEEYLDHFSKKSKEWEYRISSAFPGFMDIYKEAGNGDGYGVLHPQNGETLKNTLQHALADNPHVIQLVTWNDYGEGTIIEPTFEFEYQYLEIIQDFKKQYIDGGLNLQHEHLTLPIQIYNLRKKNPDNLAINSTLDKIFDFFVSNQSDSAIILLKSLGVQIDRHSPQVTPTGYILNQNFPNPFNSDTIINYKIPLASNVSLNVYDTTGRNVRTLYKGKKNAGSHEIQWNGKDDDGNTVASGIYFVALRAPDCFQNIKMIYLR